MKTREPRSAVEKIAYAIVGLVLIAAIALGIYYGLAYTRESASKYSDEEHLHRIAVAARKRFLNHKDYGLKSFKTYPVYDESDRMRCCLVEFEPSGFILVRINDWGCVVHDFTTAMYTYDQHCHRFSELRTWTWQRYRTERKSDKQIQYPDGDWKFVGDSADSDFGEEVYETYREVDADGEFTEYRCSPYKAADALDEKLYFLYGRICAVKRNRAYLNLVSLKEFTRKDNVGTETIAVHFIIEPVFNL